MKSNLSFSGLFLITIMLAPPSTVNAQDADQPASAASAVDDVIVVRGRNIPEPQRATSQVATFLSTEDLERAGDDSAAEALKRLSGLSIVGGKFAFVRGLGDRYSAARLNGSPLPSPEPLRRTVPLDLFPSNILQGATVQKTYSADYPGEFGGGVIDLETLRAPSEPFLDVKVGVGANLVTTAKNGIFVRGGDLDWLGYDDGLRDIPGPLQAVINTDTPLSDLSDAEQEAVGESLVNSPLSVIQEGNLGPNFEGSVDGGTSIDLNNGIVLGLTGVIGYKEDWVTKHAVRQLATTETIGIDSTQTETSLNATVNALGSAALEWGDNVIQATGLYIHSARKEAQITQGNNFNIAGGGDFQTESNSFLTRSLTMGQASGEHLLWENFTFDWRGAFARSKRGSPYERSLDNRSVGSDGIPTIVFQTRHNINFSNLTDDTWSGGVELSYEPPLPGAREATISVGYEYSDNDRDFISHPFNFILNTSIPLDVAQARIDFAFSPQNIGPNRFQLVDTNTQGVNSYRAELTSHAAYAQIDGELIPTVRTTVGVRYETADETVDVFDRFRNLDAFDTSLSNDYWLPSATVTWNFADNMQFRLGYSQTIARPQFRELAASQFLDPETDRRFFGSNLLTDSKFRNYDARYEFYLGRNQFLTLAGFYKKIEDPIEEIQFTTTDFSFASTFINSPKAVLFGGEFEYRTRFELPVNDWFEAREWLLSVNYSYTNSEIKAGPNDVVLERQGGGTLATPASEFGLDGSPLVGTPKHIVNAQFGWEGEREQFTVLLGWVGERLLARGERETKDNRLLDVFERPGVQLDAVLRQFVNIHGTDFTIALAGRNLLGTEHREFQLGTSDPDAPNGFVNFNTYERGRSLTASVTANF